MDVIRHLEAGSVAATEQVALRFTGGPHFGSHVNLTAVCADGAHLWVAGDETATLERLVLDRAAAPMRAGRQRSFPLGVHRRPEPVRVSRDGRRSALVGAPGAENLLDLLRADTHLAPFLAIPARDNGFDV